MKFKNKIYLTYEDVLSMVKQLEYDTSKWRPDLIVGLKRGGLVPAVHLSHALERPLEVLCWQTRDGDETHVNQVVLDALNDGKTVVFVDDINDSGKTLTDVVTTYEKRTSGQGVIKTAVLVEKVSSEFRTDSVALRIDDPRWMIYPWEKD